jgi:photosystem I subunit 2
MRSRHHEGILGLKQAEDSNPSVAFTPNVRSVGPRRASPSPRSNFFTLLRIVVVAPLTLPSCTPPSCFLKQTGGAAIMRKGPNLLKLARKEQCLALLNSMRAKNKINGCIYRVFPSGEVQYLHPKDGVYPEKVNKGRVGVNNNMRSIGKNANPASIKFGGKLNADGLASDGAGFSRVFDQ